MSYSDNNSAPAETLWRRAWMFSLAFHLLSSAFLAVSLHRFQGATGQPTYSAGIVLRMDQAPSPPRDAEVTAEANVFTAASPQRLEMPPLPLPPLDPPVARQEPRPVETQHVPTALTGDILAAQRAHARQQSSGSPSPSGRGLRTGAIREASQARVSVFGVTGVGTKFVYLFDRSASMEGAPLAAAKRQLLASLESLENIHQFQIIFFNSQLHPIDLVGNGRMAFATDQNKRLAKNVVGGVTADGGTERYLALKKAISYGPDVIFFLTDADDEMLASELAEVEQANGRIGATICVIEFGRAAGPHRENTLTRLAQQSGGQYGYVSTTALAK
jgi:hypothetical protein